MARPREDVYCTLLMSDSYLPGAAVLARSLRDAGTTKKLAVLVTLDSLLPDTIAELKDIFDYVLPVDRLANPFVENLHRLDRLDLRFAFTKIALWRLEQFRKIVYIDADVVALRAPDELFDIDSPFAAAPDIGWPDIFNSGVMVLSPNMNDYWSLQTLASSGASFDGADQGLLNEYFANRPWHRLSFIYNVTPNSGYQYEPAYRHFRSSINMVHFIGKEKPWHTGRVGMNIAGSGVYRELLGRWWMVYDRHYRALPSSAFGQITPGTWTVQQYVRGEERPIPFGWAATGQQPVSQPHLHVPPSLPTVVVTTPQDHPFPSDAPMFESKPPTPDFIPPETAPKSEPEPVREPEVFQPPQMAWDATRSEPPIAAQPEAQNFPSARYEMSHDRGLFQAPKYPEPPKNMYYQVPETKPAVHQKPRPLFPWEESANRQAPTRVFPADAPSPESTPAPPPPSEAETATPKSSTSETRSPVSASTPTVKVTSADPWSSFTRTNAWDDVSSIEQYVRAVKLSQDTRRGKVQVLHQASSSETTDLITGEMGITSPPVAQPRKESLILTDFPTEIERPSLPVTPAPMARPTFWGEERNKQGDLPAAEGVPEQADWNPMQKLDELRRSSLIATEGLPMSPTKEMPTRQMPSTAAPLPSSPPSKASLQNPFEQQIVSPPASGTAPAPGQIAPLVGGGLHPSSTIAAAVERKAESSTTASTTRILDEYSIA